jgi:arylsulfatase A-like enzyme
LDLLTYHSESRIINLPADDESALMKTMKALANRKVKSGPQLEDSPFQEIGINGVLIEVLLLISVILFSPAEASELPEKNGTRPNILFIAVDDLRPELGCYGVEDVISPNIDRLADRGVTFHRAFVVPRKYWELYDRDEIPRAANQFFPREMPEMAFGDHSLGGFYELQVYIDYLNAPSPFERPLTESQQRELKHGYYASVSFIDEQVGRLLAELDQLGLAQNTIVVLWGDHGWKLGEHNGWCKQTNYEIDTRVPLLIYAPGANANGKSCGSLVELVDIYPTLCELAGLPVPEVVEGEDGRNPHHVVVTKDGQVETVTAPKPQAWASKPRPNIVFFMADDWSWPHAGFLGDTVVTTPNIDRIAREGVIFDNAFVSVPSCTPSRLSILTGQHHWRLQEGDSLGGSLREEYDVYTEMLQADGYRIGWFGKGVWPSKHTFRKRDSFGKRFPSFDAFIQDRKPGEPFCYWHGGLDPHRPYDYGIGVKSGIKLADIKVPACLPDNETVRSDLADYYWEVGRFDREVGQVLTTLETMGELDNTILVVSGDNGMPFPRCKGTLYDLGTRVPLAVRWGAKVAPNRKVTDFVSLCDFAPTFLEAAGLKPGKDMTGRSLLPLLTSDASGQIDPARTFVLTGLEQHVYSNPSRAIRTRDFLYIRNFSPDTWATGEAEGENLRYDFANFEWPSVSEAFSFNCDPSPTKQFLRFHRHDEGVKRLADLAFGRHAEEELYDLRKDPDQLRNVAFDVCYAAKRKELRARLDSELRKAGDPRSAAADGPDSKPPAAKRAQSSAER